MARFPVRRQGFTLIELLVVIAIIAILIGLLVPAVQKVREAAARTQCINNMKQIALSVHSYHDVNKRIPPNAINIAYSWGTDSTYSSTQTWTWIARILPYLEQGNLSTKYNIPLGTLGGATAGLPSPMSVLSCPSATDAIGSAPTDWPNIGGVSMSLTNYRGVCGSNWAWGNFTNTGPSGNNNGLDAGDGVFYRSDGNRKLTLIGISDGTSNTLMIGESTHNYDQHCGGWAYPNYVTGTCAIPLNYDDGPPGTPSAGYSNWPNRYSFRSSHPGGGNFAKADATVIFIANSIDINVYRALATIKGGETVSVP